MQLKANAVAANGARIANGELVTVAKIKTGGEIILVDGRTLPMSYRQFVRGYAVTSYGSQGKTVDHVLFADSASARRFGLQTLIASSCAGFRKWSEWPVSITAPLGTMARSRPTSPRWQRATRRLKTTT